MVPSPGLNRARGACCLHHGCGDDRLLPGIIDHNRFRCGLLELSGVVRLCCSLSNADGVCVSSCVRVITAACPSPAEPAELARIPRHVNSLGERFPQGPATTETTGNAPRTVTDRPGCLLNPDAVRPIQFSGPAEESPPIRRHSIRIHMARPVMQRDRECVRPVASPERFHSSRILPETTPPIRQ